MTSEEVKELVGRLRPRWVIDEPVGQAIVLFGFKPEWAPTVEALNRFLVANNALKTEAVTALEALQAELEKVKGDVYVPGEFCCAKCGFFLSQFSLNANTGAVSDRDEPGERCPNDGSPLWRVTWKQRANEHYERAAEEMARAEAAEALVTELREGLQRVVREPPDDWHSSTIREFEALLTKSAPQGEQR